MHKISEMINYLELKTNCYGTYIDTQEYIKVNYLENIRIYKNITGSDKAYYLLQIGTGEH